MLICDKKALDEGDFHNTLYVVCEKAECHHNDVKGKWGHNTKSVQRHSDVTVRLLTPVLPRAAGL